MNAYDDLYGEELDDGEGNSFVNEIEQRLQLQTENKQLKVDIAVANETISKLNRQIDKLRKEKSLVVSQNQALGKNISALYKTAKVEIERKDAMIKLIREGKKSGESVSACPKTK
eukprot:CFRG4434T1